MARLKRSSRTLEKAERRLAGIRAIDYNLNLGNDLTAERYNILVSQVRQEIASYNTLLSKLDEASIEIKKLERNLARYSENMLMGVAIQYGKDSSEYVMAGGRGQGRRNNYHTAQVPPEVEPVSESVNGNQAIFN